MVQNWREWLIDQISSEGPRQAGEMIWQEAYEAQPRKMPCPAPGRNNSVHQHRLETDRLEGSLAGKDLWVLMGANQPIKHQFDYEQWRAFGRESHCCVVSRLRKVILLLYTAPEGLCLECRAQFWSLQYESWVCWHRSGLGLQRWWWDCSIRHTRRGWELELCLENARRDPINVCEYLIVQRNEGCEVQDSHPSFTCQWCLVARLKATRTNPSERLYF